MKTLNQAQMEELMDFFWENYQKDLAREAKDEVRFEGILHECLGYRPQGFLGISIKACFDLP